MRNDGTTRDASREAGGNGGPDFRSSDFRFRIFTGLQSSTINGGNGHKTCTGAGKFLAPDPNRDGGTIRDASREERGDGDPQSAPENPH